jgi:hypothetical protein
MLISDKFGVIAIVLLLVTVLCALNGKVFDIEILCKLSIIFANAAIVCFIAFVVLSVI